MNPETHPKTIRYSTFKSKATRYRRSRVSTDLEQFRYGGLAVRLRRQSQRAAGLQNTPVNGGSPSSQPQAAPELPYLKKSWLIKLTEWKLGHGTFRPRLLALVSSNSEKEVRSVTAEAFSIYNPMKVERNEKKKEDDSKNNNEDDNDEEPDDDYDYYADYVAKDNDRLIKALNHLTTLRGVGPATASLILSCWDQFTVPFFSDEVFRWLHFDDLPSTETKTETEPESETKAGTKPEIETDQPPSKRRKTTATEPAPIQEKTKTKAGAGAGGWQRKITYSVKEYRSLLERWQAFRARLETEPLEDWEVDPRSVWARDLEKAAYVMFREECGDSK